MASPLVYVIVLNWNGWRDTVECLESLLRSDYADFRVIVCDNASSDSSLQRIEEWAEGDLVVDDAASGRLRHLWSPPISKPISHVRYDRRRAEQGGEAGVPGARLTLVETGGNLGFAGGCNIGLRYALARDDFDFVWLLNNDTVVEPTALSALVERMQQRPDAGLCGSTLRAYDDPEHIQALGGAAYSYWFGFPRRIDADPVDASRDPSLVERRLAYIVGASMMVSRLFLYEIGLLAEDYFMCFEELDWATRARGRYGLCFASSSVVYHKDGQSLRRASGPTDGASASDYYNMVNRLVFTRKFHPWALPTVYLGLLMAMTNSLLRRRGDRAAMISRLILGGERREQRARQ